MSNNLMVAEPIVFYNSKQSENKENKYYEILVDCPGRQGLFTYKSNEEIEVKIGDIVSIPFGNQTIGGIVIKELSFPPKELEIEKIKEIEDIIVTGFFTDKYWQLLEKVSSYYYTELMIVIKTALPPGLLRKETRRIRLNFDNLPSGVEELCNEQAREIITLLKQQKDGDYSEKYLKNKIRKAHLGLRFLLKRDWVISYFEPPKKVKPKLQKAVSLINDNPLEKLGDKQRQALETLKNLGGEMWLKELIEKSHVSSAVINSLALKNCVIIEYREKLRLAQELNINADKPKELTEKQQAALNKINKLTGYNEVLLHGITGSGKTEVYLQAITPILKTGKSALVLVPEIGLTPQLTDRFTARFGDKVCVYHSGLNEGERYDTWRNLLNGQQYILIGTRSAIFAPLKNLGIIILDEEHDSSFKQHQPAPNYHAKTVAQWRAKLENCPLILGSATPSIETWLNIKKKPDFNKHYLNLPERIGNSKLPTIEIVDLRNELKQGNRSIFSRKLQNELKKIPEKKEQAILFVPRRGHSTFVSCRSCGYVIECPHCDVSLSYHYPKEGATELLRCHYCNYSALQPKQCPECQSPYLKFFGSGTQKVILELNKLFPEMRSLRFDSDTTSTKDAHRRLLEHFRQGNADVLIGTQMLTKGIDIAQVTLVGVVAADGLLNLSDYRATERAFQTLTQVAGRAGRGNNQGKVIIQTYTPEHPVIEAVYRNNYEGFIEEELRQREELTYPPFGKIIVIKMSGLEEKQVQQTAEIITAEMEKMSLNCEILGPAPANIMRIAQRYRWQIILKFEQETIENLFKIEELRKICPSYISLTIDVDPLSIE